MISSSIRLQGPNFLTLQIKCLATYYICVCFLSNWIDSLGQSNGHSIAPFNTHFRASSEPNLGYMLAI